MRFLRTAASAILGTVLFIVASPSARADFFVLGISGGINVASASTANLAPPPAGTINLANQSLTGFSYAGSLTLDILQDSIFGFEIAEDYQNVNASAGNNTFQGKLALTNLSAHFMVKWVAHYHQLGVGYVYANFLSPSSFPTSAPSTVFNGFSITTKDYLIVDKKNGPFITGRLFFFTPGGAYSPISTLSLLLGFDI